jgi:hypothetical protein
MFRKLCWAMSLSSALVTFGVAHAYERGAAPWAQPPGLVLGDAATAPPPGLYMFNQVSTFQQVLVGPGAPLVGGTRTKVNVDGEATGLLFVPGWTFLGGTYDAVIVQPFLNETISSPINFEAAGLRNTYIVPAELSWNLGNSGFFIKTGLGIDVPNGSISGPTGLNGIGSPWWTFQPEFVISYLSGGWNLTANIFGEINTANSITGYRSGDILHAEFTATKQMGKWTVGPVAAYVGQVTKDTASPTFYGGTINTGSYDIWGVGALVGYDFGPASLKVWALDQVYSTASGGNMGPPGVDTASITKGWSVFASLSYRLWAPEQPQPQNPSRLTLK